MKRKRGADRRKPTKNANVAGVDTETENLVSSNALSDAANDPVNTRMEVDIAQSNATTSRGPTTSSGGHTAGSNNDKSNEKTSHDISLHGNYMFKDVTCFGSSTSDPHVDARALQDEMTNAGEHMSSCNDYLDNQKELKAALSVIKTVMKMDASKPFNTPADPVALGITDYFDIINTPMDFSTICKYIDLGFKYINSKDIYRDVALIWDNCSKYNKDGTKIVELMKQVRTTFLKLWSAAGLYTQEPSNGHVHVTPASESSFRPPTYRPEPSVAPDFNNCCSEEYDMGQNQPDSPLSDDNAMPEPEEDTYLSQPGSSIPQASLLGNEHTRDSPAFEKKSRGRGPTRCLKLIFQEKRISITTNELGQPVGVDARKLISFLGTIARDGHKAPLNYIEWRAMPEAYKENMWKEVQEKFIIDPKVKYWIMKSLGKKWKDWKARLKSERYLTRATNEERLANLDERVLPDQWEYLVSHWNTEKAERRSAANKACNAKLVLRHVGGSKSYARLREEEKEKRPDKKPPTRAELFMLTRLRKDGKPINEETATIIEKLRQTQDAAETSTVPDEAFAQLVGRRKNGRVRCVGLPPTYRPESSVVPDINNSSLEEYDMNKKESDSPLSGDNVMPEPEEDAHLSQPGSSTPQASPLESDSPLSGNSMMPEPEEDAHLSQPGSSSPQAALLGIEYTRDSPALEKKSRGRGPSRCLNLLFQAKRILITTNELGQPVGVDARKLISFLGTIARDGHKAPLNYIEWRAMPEAYKENMWKEVQEKFIIEAKSKYWIMKSLSKKWKDWKARLKSERYLTCATHEERLANLDERVLPDQWEYLVSYWNTEKAERRSAANKACNAKLVLRHVGGSKSYARLREEEKEKRPDKKPPTRAELFILTRVRKDGKPVNEETAAIIEKLQQTMASQTQDVAETSTVQDEAFAQLVGRRKDGLVRCVGLNSSPSDPVSRKYSKDVANKLVLETKAEVLEMKSKMGTMEETCAQMATQMAAMMSMMSSLHKNTTEGNMPGPDHTTSGSGEVQPLQQRSPSPSTSSFK